MITAIAFVVVAAAGALARAEAGRRLNRHDGFPLGTLTVNVAGAFAVGLLHGVAPPAATVAAVAGLGAMTTFSSFARDVVALVEVRRAALAGWYLALSVTAGVAAAWVGLQLAPGA